MLSFAVLLPAAALHALARQSRTMIAEVAWRAEGIEQLLFMRAYSDVEAAAGSHWQACTCALPPGLAPKGDLVFRVRHSDGGAPDKHAYVLWGMPCLRKEGALVPATMAQLESARRRIGELEASIAELQSQIDEAREASERAKRERDEKVHRVAELHEASIELEKRVEELSRQIAAKEPGMSDKLRGLFRKQ